MRVVAAVALVFFASVGTADALSGEPRQVCDALKAEGLPTSTWTPFDDPFSGVLVRSYRCISEPLAVRGGSDRFVTSLTYFAEGRLRERVETIRLVLNVHDPATREAGRQRFARVADRLLSSLEAVPPPELAVAIRDARPGNWPLAGAMLRFEIWQSPIERLRLTVDLRQDRRR